MKSSVKISVKKLTVNTINLSVKNILFFINRNEHRRATTGI